MFNLVKGSVIDWMHSVCLGVTKSLVNLWLSAENRGNEFWGEIIVSITCACHPVWKLLRDKFLI